MARDPNKYRGDEDVNDTDEEEEEDDFDGRPEQSGEDDDSGVEDDSAPLRTGRRGARSPTGRRDI
jgi:hypothetical protein